RPPGEDHVVADEHVVGVELAGLDQVHPGLVAQRQPVEPVVALQHHQHPRGVGHRVEGGQRRLGRGPVAGEEPLDDVHPAGPGAVGEGPAQRRGLHLLRRALAVAARHRAVDHAAAGELGRPDGAVPGATGALLAVRLGAAAADLTAGLGLVGPLAGGRQLRHDHLVHERDVGLHVEDLRRQVDGAARAAVGADDVDGGHCCSPPADAGCLAAVRMSSSPPLGPGTAPLTSSRFRSGWTSWMVRFWTVWRTPPIRPAIRVPLKTRAGVAHAPMAPGERCLRSTPWEPRSPWKPCRFITPAKPLPLVRPVTSTSWPGANRSTATSWPSVYSLASVVRSSTRCRRGATPALAKWPDSGLLTLRGSIAPYASCTAE